MAAINRDPAVTEFVNRPVDEAATRAFLAKTFAHREEDGFGLWALEPRQGSLTGRLIGFAGAAYPTFVPELATRPELISIIHPDDVSPPRTYRPLTRPGPPNRGRTPRPAALAPPMRGENLAARSAAAWSLARRQHGVLTRRDLLALGFSEKAIEHRIATGRLHPLSRGVYAVGRGELSREGRWMAAVRCCGDGAVLSHGSAAALWGIGKEFQQTIEVSVRRRSWPRRRGVKVRSRPSLPVADVTIHFGIPVTTPARTILDLAVLVSDGSLERLINEADVNDLIDPESLRRWLQLRSGEPGVKRLRRLLDPETFRLSDSELERLFRPIALAAGLPQPETKALVNGFEVDFHWPSLFLVVECDSLRYHRTAQKQTRDLLRDQTHTAAGLTTLRFSHWQVRHEPGQVRAVLTQTRQAGLRPLTSRL